MTAAAVEEGELARGALLGRGGQGRVYALPGHRVDRRWPAVYKEYLPELLPALDGEVLAAMVELSGGLRRSAMWLYGRAAWPAALVRRDGRACGFVMRAVPEEFRFSTAGRGRGLGRAAEARLATLEFLLNEDSYADEIGLSVGDQDRLLLLSDLAATLQRLHTLGLAVGDLSPRNILFAIDPRPRCFFIDCDAMRLRGLSVLPQVETPDWQTPPGEEKGTPAGDVYKFGLLAVRLLARDQTAADPAALAPAGRTLQALAVRSLMADPAARPTPREWRENLWAAVSRASAASTGGSLLSQAIWEYKTTPSPAPPPADAAGSFDGFAGADFGQGHGSAAASALRFRSVLGMPGPSPLRPPLSGPSSLPPAPTTGNAATPGPGPGPTPAQQAERVARISRRVWIAVLLLVGFAVSLCIGFAAGLLYEQHHRTTLDPHLFSAAPAAFGRPLRR
jgi:hypothetical protein